MRVLFIYNSTSGKQIIDKKDKYLSEIASSDHDFTVFEIKPNQGSYEYLMETDDIFDVIVGVGGDGTISKIVDAMVERNLTSKLLIIPAGSTNEYSLTLGLDETSSDNWLSLIEHGKTIEVDVGSINDKHFTYVAAFGNFTEVSYATPQKLKNFLGHTAYWLYGVIKLRTIKNYRYKVSFNGEVYEESFLFGMISNAYQFGRIFKYGDDEMKINDGVFEVLLVKRPKKTKDYLLILNHLFQHNYEGDMFIKGETDHIVFESKNNKYTWNLDGEKGNQSEKIEIKVLNRKLKVITA